MKGKKLRTLVAVATFCATVLTTVTASAATTADKTKNPFSWDNATVYFALTDRFNNADTSNDHSYGRGLDQNGNVENGYEGNPGAFQGGDLKGLTQKIKDGYFNDLGVNAIWLTAPYEQIHGYTSGNDAGGNADSNGKGFPYYAYHGYWALDYSNIDANMGTAEDFKEFVDTAHANGIRVVMDVVLNHVGYTTMKDADEYNFGGLADGWQNYYYGPLTDLVGGAKEDSTYYDKDSDNWAKNWWGSDFVRSSAGYKGYPVAGQGAGWKDCLCGLPDIKTESTDEVGVPPLLANKWKEEGRYDKEVASLNDFFNKRNLPKTPRNYVIKWLTDYIRNYGIDGFRCDTANQVDLESWNALNKEADAAFEEYKEKNPDKVLDKDADFWTVGESWGHGVNKDAFYTQGGFSAMINFGFKGTNLASLKNTYDDLSKVNKDDSFNVLSYISSHDDGLYNRNNLKDGGTALLLAPGAVQIFYGDESGRPLSWTDRFTSEYKDQCYRSFMNWDDLKDPDSNDSKLLAHWQKLGEFRDAHLAVGAGTNVTLNDSPYIFGRTYSKNGVFDKVVCAVGVSGEVEINLKGMFSDDASVRDAYTGNTATVENGKVKFTADSNGVLLLEKGDNSPDVAISTASKVTTVSDNKYKYYGDSLKLTLSVDGAETGTYSIDDGEEKEFKNGDKITIGQDLEYGEENKVTVKASNSDGKASQTCTYAKADPNFQTKVHVKKPDGWGALKAYVYSGSGDSVDEVKAWPGVDMKDEGDGTYSYTLPTGFADAKIIINDGSNQYPGQGQEGYPLQDGSEMMYEDGAWTTYVESTSPKASISKEDCTFKDSLELTLGCKNAKEATYSIDGKEAVKYKDGDKITIGEDAEPGDEIKVTLNVTDGKENDKKTFTYTKKQIVKSSKVYFKAPENWGDPKVYVYNEDVSPKKEVCKWPGTKMTDEGDGLYSYTLEDFEEDAYVIFTDGSNQDPGKGQKGYKLTNGSKMILEDGNWKEYKKTTSPKASISEEDCTFKDSLELTLGCKNAKEATYSIDGKEAVKYKDGDKITIGEDAEPGDEVKVTLKVTNGKENDTKTYVYTKEKEVKSSKIYFKAPENWGDPKVYVYNEDVSPKKELSAWPGKKMKDEGNGLYSYTLKDWEEDAYVIFTDGDNQDPGKGEKGYKLTNGSKMILEDGNWEKYEK